MADATRADKSAAAWLQAIGEPARLAILRALAGGSKNVTELAKITGMEIVNVSHHLGVMRSANMVSHEKHGRFVVYALAEKTYEVGKGEVVLLRDGVKVTLRTDPDREPA